MKSPPIHPHLCQMNPTHILIPISLKSNLLLSYHPRRDLTSGFPPKPCFISVPSDACHMSNPSHFSCFDLPSNTCWGIQIMKLLAMHFSSAFFEFLPLRPRYLPQVRKDTVSNLDHCSVQRGVTCSDYDVLGKTAPRWLLGGGTGLRERGRLWTPPPHIVT